MCFIQTSMNKIIVIHIIETKYTILHGAFLVVILNHAREVNVL